MFANYPEHVMHFSIMLVPIKFFSQKIALVEKTALASISQDRCSLQWKARLTSPYAYIYYWQTINVTWTLPDSESSREANTGKYVWTFY